MAHVKIGNIPQNPVFHVTPASIVTSDGEEHEFDVIAIATGFDSFTGGFKDMNVTGLNDQRLVTCGSRAPGPHTASHYLGFLTFSSSMASRAPLLTQIAIR